MAQAIELNFPTTRRIRPRFRPGRHHPLHRRRILKNVQVDALRIINFKAFEDTGWIPIKPITYLMGGNSAGKSSILKAIKFISSVLTKDAPPFDKEKLFLSEFPLSDSKTGLDLGTIGDTIFDGKQHFTIELRTYNPKYKVHLKYSFKFGMPKDMGSKQITNVALLSLAIRTTKGTLIEWSPEKNKVNLSHKVLQDFGYNHDTIHKHIKKDKEYRLKIL